MAVCFSHRRRHLPHAPLTLTLTPTLTLTLALALALALTLTLTLTLALALTLTLTLALTLTLTLALALPPQLLNTPREGGRRWESFRGSCLGCLRGSSPSS